MEIEAQAKRRLADECDECDAAQERGEIVGPSGGGDSTVLIRNAATAAELGLSRKDIHEARIAIRRPAGAPFGADRYLARNFAAIARGATRKGARYTRINE